MTLSNPSANAVLNPAASSAKGTIMPPLPLLSVADSGMRPRVRMWCSR